MRLYMDHCRQNRDTTHIKHRGQAGGNICFQLSYGKVGVDKVEDSKSRAVVDYNLNRDREIKGPILFFVNNRLADIF